MPDVVTYKNVNAIVRAARCAIFINKNSDYWRYIVRGTIAAASEIWGGRSFLIIPTDGASINPKFWEILEAYNPDHLGIYHLTLSELETIERDKHERIKQQFLSQWQSKGYDPVAFESWFAQQADVSLVDPFTITPTLEQELLERLNPFHFVGSVISQNLRGSGGFRFPFTEVSSLIPFANKAVSQVVAPDFRDDIDMELVLQSQTGSVSGKYEERLAAQQVQVNTGASADEIIDIIPLAFGSRFWAFRLGADYMADTSFALSMLHLGEYYDPRLHLEYREPVVVILGDTVDDFCAYYSLSRLHRNVCWLPLAWLRDTSRAIRRGNRNYEQGSRTTEPLSLQQRLTVRLIDVFNDLIEQGSSEKYIQMSSSSLSVRQLIAYRQQFIMCRSTWIHDTVPAIKVVSLDGVSTKCTMHVFEEDNYSNNQSVTFVNRKSVSPVVTPKPKNFKSVQPSGHYWVTSLQIEDYVPPTLPELSQQIVGASSLALDSRVANDGISYHCPNMSYFGGGIDAVLVRPTLEMPDEMALLTSYFKTIGVSISYSDKGNYFIDALERFGGLTKAGNFIKKGTTRSILEKFMSRAGSGDDRVIYLTNDQRTYLSYSAFEECLRGDRTSELIDDLVGRHIVERGCIFQCSRCRLTSWYSLNVLTGEFTCTRCGLQQQFTRTHWKWSEEARWYYKLAETVYQFYFHHSHLTVQTLHNLKSRSARAFLYLPEIDLLNFPSAGKKKEIDVACISDGHIILGECKTRALQPGDAKTLEMLVRRLRKPPASIVFATNETSVSDIFTSRIAGLPSPEVLLFDDLYDA